MYKTQIEENDGESVIKIPDELSKKMGWNEHTIFSVTLNDDNTISIREKTDWTVDQLQEDDNFEKVMDDIIHNQTVHYIIHDGKSYVLKPHVESTINNEYENPKKYKIVKKSGEIRPSMSLMRNSHLYSFHEEFINALMHEKLILRVSDLCGEIELIHAMHPKINGNADKIKLFGYTDLLVLEDNMFTEKHRISHHDVVLNVDNLYLLILSNYNMSYMNYNNTSYMNYNLFDTSELEDKKEFTKLIEKFEKYNINYKFMIINNVWNKYKEREF